MALHLIPDDGAPHAPTTECGCDPQPQLVTTVDGQYRPAFVHPVVPLSELYGDGGEPDVRTGHPDPSGS